MSSTNVQWAAAIVPRNASPFNKARLLTIRGHDRNTMATQ
jgi:hypothetical protein